MHLYVVPARGESARLGFSPFGAKQQVTQLTDVTYARCILLKCPVFFHKFESALSFPRPAKALTLSQPVKACTPIRASAHLHGAEQGC